MIKGSKNKMPRNKFPLGEAHPNWKGDEVGYFALHSWIRREFGKPTICELCSSSENVQWASKNQKYTRQREDWIQLCASCHKKYDVKMNRRVAWNKGKKVDRTLHPTMGHFKKHSAENRKKFSKRMRENPTTRDIETGRFI